MDTPNFKPKSFWQRPEGTTGMFILVGAALATYFVGGQILSTLFGLFNLGIAVVGRFITLAAMCTVLGAMLYVLTNHKFLTLCDYMFKSAMRKATGMFIEIDPIGIMRCYIRDLKDKREQMGEAISKLDGQLRASKEQSAANQRAKDKAMALAAEAKKRSNNSQFIVQSHQAGRLETFNNETLIPLIRTMEVTLRALKKYFEVTDAVILDMENDVQQQEVKRKVMTASWNAMRAARTILQGGDGKEMYDQAMETSVEQYGQKMGEIDNFLETSKSFVDGLDLQNGVYEEEALKKLQAWESKADSLVLGDKKQQLIEDVNMHSPIIDVMPLPDQISGEYNKFLNKE